VLRVRGFDKPVLSLTKGSARTVVGRSGPESSLRPACLNQPKPELTPRQQQIYGLIGQGLSNKEIAKATALTVATVETHRKAIAQKLGVRGAELIRQAALLSELDRRPGGTR
jgi:DNA-binding NarL/FixJ family response regulator